MQVVAIAGNVLAAGASLIVLFFIASAAAVHLLSFTLGSAAQSRATLFTTLATMVLVEEACRTLAARLFVRRLSVAAFAAASGLIGVLEQAIELLVIRASPHMQTPGLLFMAAPVLVHAANGALLMHAFKGRMSAWAAFAIAVGVHLAHNTQSKFADAGSVQILLWTGVLLSILAGVIVLDVRKTPFRSRIVEADARRP
jgi:hypothetical protein